MEYCDLCINVKDTDNESLHRLLTRLYDMGYKTVAINQVLDESVFETEQKKKKKSQNEPPKIIIEPYPVDDLKKKFATKLNILSRLTFIYTDPAKTYSMAQSNTLNKFDIYSVMPRGQVAFQFACAQLNADIITVNGSSTGLKFSRKLYSQAVERGLHFEIQYADLISPATRKTAIHYSHLFHIFGKSKNVIISSGASTILGLSEDKAKRSIHGQCHHLILKSEGRRYGKAVFSIHKDEEFISESISDEDDEEDEDDDDDDDEDGEPPSCKKLKL
ncbi:hypothetical protein PV326_004754 [Microctonus aethiopoides]|nr:hypothetical protein PV326_004754 [Microctonus aethiopoides]